MRYKVRDIDEHGLQIRLPVTAEWLTTECPGIDARPGAGGLQVVGRLEHAGGDSYLLRGDVKGHLEMGCGRCLEPAQVELALPLAISFVERDEGEEDDEDDGGDIVPFSGGVIDIGPSIRDEIVMALPIGPVCRPDCAGICPVCGGNRNASPCECEEKQRRESSKFASLSKVKI